MARKLVFVEGFWYYPVMAWIRERSRCERNLYNDLEGNRNGLWLERNNLGHH